MATKRAPKYKPLFGSFVPLQALWDGGASGGPLFPSESAARWFIRVERLELVAAEAIAIDRGRILIDVDRLQSVRQRIALENARRAMPG